MSRLMSNSDFRNLSHACKSGIILVRVLVKAKFQDSKATDPKSQTELLTAADEQSVRPFVRLSVCALFFSRYIT
jgi:hypothetical protein